VGEIHPPWAGVEYQTYASAHLFDTLVTGMPIAIHVRFQMGYLGAISVYQILAGKLHQFLFNIGDQVISGPDSKHAVLKTKIT